MDPTDTRAPQYARSTYIVENMTCGACLAEVMEAVRRLPHVNGVAVDLVVGGGSTLIVRSDVALVPQVVIDSVAGVGFRALPASTRRARHLQRTFTGSAHDLNRGVAT